MQLIFAKKHSSLGAAALAVALLATAPAPAQPAPPPQPPVHHETLLAHTAVKSATFLGATTVAIFSIFAVGTGNLVTTAALTAGTMGAAYVIYPVNEYMWEHFFPAPPPTTANGHFDVAASLWRNTAKYVTWKVAIVSAKLSWIYAYTGSVVSTAALGGATTLALPVVFYANNMAWDWYDWRQQHLQTAPSP